MTEPDPTSSERRTLPSTLGAWPLVACAIVLTALVLWPMLVRPGFVLGYDMVFVPDQPLEPWMWGAGNAPPRSVPQDLYVALLDDVIPGWLLQRLLLIAGVLMAALGMLVLLAPVGMVGQLVAMTFYAWSPWMLERLVIGHWGLLLAFAASPWVLHLAARAREPGSRRAGGLLVLVVFAGTWVPTGGVLLAGLGTAVLVWPGAGRRPWSVVAGILVVQFSWLLPAVSAASLAQGSESLFGIRADGRSGAVLTAVAGSGIWNPAVAPASRAGALAWIASLVVLIGVLWGLGPLRRAVGSAVVGPLLLVGSAGLLWAILTGLGPTQAVVAWVEALPGGGLLRDGQKWLAPWWLVVSAACGAAAADLRGRLEPHPLARLVAVAALLPLLLLPDLAGGAAGRLRPHRYPADWEQVRAVLARSADGTAVLSLPWSAFRRYEWNGDRVVLDPAPRYLPGEVLTSSDLLVRRGDHVVTLPSDDPMDHDTAAALTGAMPASALRRLGVGWILVQRDQPAGPLGEALEVPGSHSAYQGPWLELLRLPAAVARPSDERFPWLSWLAIGSVLIGAGIRAAGWRVRPSDRLD